MIISSAFFVCTKTEREVEKNEIINKCERESHHNKTQVDPKELTILGGNFSCKQNNFLPYTFTLRPATTKTSTWESMPGNLPRKEPSHHRWLIVNIVKHPRAFGSVLISSRIQSGLIAMQNDLTEKLFSFEALFVTLQIELDYLCRDNCYKHFISLLLQAITVAFSTA